MATAMSICIAAHQRVSEATFSKKDYENVIDALLKEKANGKNTNNKSSNKTIKKCS